MAEPPPDPPPPPPRAMVGGGAAEPKRAEPQQISPRAEPQVVTIEETMDERLGGVNSCGRKFLKYCKMNDLKPEENIPKVDIKFKVCTFHLCQDKIPCLPPFLSDFDYFPDAFVFLFLTYFQQTVCPTLMANEGHFTWKLC